jgi:hypothetical protein
MALDLDLPPPTSPRESGTYQRIADMLRTGIAVVAVLTLAGSIGLIAKFIIDPDGSEEFTVSRRPSLYYEVFDNDQRAFPEEIYERVIGSAHNSGGRIEATVEALIFGADAIEADVIAINGRLYAGHDPILPLVGDWFFRGPTLEQVWTASYRADAFKLDLKETSPEYVDLVVDFINSRPEGRDIVVASRSSSVLRSIQQRAPRAIRLLSVSDDAAFARLQDDEGLQRLVDGITVRESIIDFGMMGWLDERGISAFAWTVNDIERVNELIRMGVAGITTDNLAILSLLGGQSRQEPGSLASTPQSTPEVAEQPAADQGDDHRPRQADLDAAVEETDLGQHEVVGDEEHHQRREDRHAQQSEQPAVGQQPTLPVVVHRHLSAARA